MAESTIQRTMQALSPWTRRSVQVTSAAHTFDGNPILLTHRHAPPRQASALFAKRVIQRYTKPAIAPAVQAVPQPPIGPKAPSAMPFVSGSLSRVGQSISWLAADLPVEPTATESFASPFTTLQADTEPNPEQITIAAAREALSVPPDAPGVPGALPSNIVYQPPTPLPSEPPTSTAETISPQQLLTERPASSLVAMIEERMQRAQLGLPPIPPETEEDEAGMAGGAADLADPARVQRAPDAEQASSAPMTSQRLPQPVPPFSLVAMIEERIQRAQAGLPPIPPLVEEEEIQATPVAESLRASAGSLGEVAVLPVGDPAPAISPPSEAAGARPTRIMSAQIEERTQRATSEQLPQRFAPKPRTAQRLPPQVRRIKAYSSVEEFGSNSPEQPSLVLSIVRPAAAPLQAEASMPVEESAIEKSAQLPAIPEVVAPSPDFVAADDSDDTGRVVEHPLASPAPFTTATAEAPPEQGALDSMAASMSATRAPDRGPASPLLQQQPSATESKSAHQPLEQRSFGDVVTQPQAAAQQVEQAQVTDAPLEGSITAQPPAKMPEAESALSTEVTNSSEERYDTAGSAHKVAPHVAAPEPVIQSFGDTTSSTTTRDAIESALPTDTALAEQQANPVGALDHKDIEHIPDVESRIVQITHLADAESAPPSVAHSLSQLAVVQRSASEQPASSVSATPLRQDGGAHPAASATSEEQEIAGTESLTKRSNDDSGEPMIRSDHLPAHSGLPLSISQRAPTIQRTTERVGGHEVTALVLARSNRSYGGSASKSTQPAHKGEDALLAETHFKPGAALHSSEYLQPWVQRTESASSSTSSKQVLSQAQTHRRLIFRAPSIEPAFDELPTQLRDTARDRPSISTTPPSMPTALPQVVGMALQPAAASERATLPDLDGLAQQVLPLIKRMLAIERERGLHF